ncbi:unnamed protein product [Ambrosiozyma monospora]|uniref:Unnamed protein product n=1 Tax=Ambrosiozyma monospora TaxID=43982 RepID=A0ACB5TWF0_AMBMO|nr:unnamed protein product [Ambrosiozyma monospora]
MLKYLRFSNYQQVEETDISGKTQDQPNHKESSKNQKKSTPIMSFFGFDPTGPPSSKRNEAEELDFDEEDDAFNEETFGADVTDIRKDFDFGYGAKPQAEESILKPATESSIKPGLSYAKAAQEELLQPMAALWGDSTSNEEEKKEVTEDTDDSKKVLSLEEIEAKLRQQAPSSAGFNNKC